MWYLFCSDLENILLLFSLRIYIWKNMYTLVMWCFFLFCFFFSICMNLLSVVCDVTFLLWIYPYRLFAPIVNNHIVIFFSTHGGLSWPECSAATGMWGHVTHPWVLCFLVVGKHCGRSLEEGGFGSGCTRNEKTKRLPLKMTWLEMMVFNEQVSEENTRVAVDWKLPLKKA